MNKFKIFMSLVIVFLMAQSCGAEKINNGTKGTIRKYLVDKYPGYKLVEQAVLSKDDLRLFKKDHGIDCPGLVKIDFFGSGKPAYAALIYMKKKKDFETKLIVMSQNKMSWDILLLDTSTLTRVPVIWKESAGKYQSVYGDKSFDSKNPVLMYVGYESWAIVYAWLGDKVTKLWLAD